VADDVVDEIDCGVWCVMDWGCTGYSVDWVTPDAGYCMLVRQEDPILVLEYLEGYIFYRENSAIVFPIKLDV
jgi:hypothetical protein